MEKNSTNSQKRPRNNSGMSVGNSKKQKTEILPSPSAAKGKNNTYDPATYDPTQDPDYDPEMNSLTQGMGGLGSSFRGGFRKHKSKKHKSKKNKTRKHKSNKKSKKNNKH